MGLLTWILIGLVAGFIAQLTVGDGGGIVRMLVLGIAGAIVGGLISARLGYGTVTGFNTRSVIIAVFGAVVVIVVVRALTSGRHGGLI